MYRLCSGGRSNSALVRQQVTRKNFWDMLTFGSSYENFLIRIINILITSWATIRKIRKIRIIIEQSSKLELLLLKLLGSQIILVRQPPDLLHHHCYVHVHFVPILHVNNIKDIIVCCTSYNRNSRKTVP